MTLLEFARGPMLHFALLVFVFGVIWRLLAVAMLGFRKRYSEERNSNDKALMVGTATCGLRSWPHKEFIGRTAFGEAVGYGYHIGLFAIVLLGAPHVIFWQNLFGFSAPWWPTLPGGLVTVISVLTVVLMLIATIRRMMHPPLRQISNFDDYFTLAILYAIMVSGLWAVLGGPGRYEFILATHIISFNLLLIWFPFGKLMHAFYIFPARFINGYLHAKKGAAT